MADEAKAPETPKQEPPQEAKAAVKTTKHPRLRGLLRFIKGSLYFVPIVNLIPIGIDLYNSGNRYNASRKEKNGRFDSLLDTGYSGASAALGAASYLSLYEPLKNSVYLSWIPGIGNMLSGLRDMIAPRGYEK